jgi:hypothetical protein
MAESKGLSFTKEELTNLSLEFSDREIGARLGVTASNIKYWRHKLGVETQYEIHKLTFTRAEWIELTNEYSDPQLAKFLNVHSNAIRDWRVKLCIPAKHRLKRHKTYDVNELFFRKIESESQAYSLGFICGDGNIHPRKSSFSISVNEKDIDVLYKIRNAMLSNAPIPLVDNNRGFATKWKSAILNINRRTMVNDLVNLGVNPQKSKTIHYPDIPKSLDRHFIRGLWDSDGCVIRWNFNFCGASPIVMEVRDKIKEHTEHVLSAYNRTDRIFGLRRDKDVIHWIYQDSTIYLERKFQNFLKHWS